MMSKIGDHGDKDYCRIGDSGGGVGGGGAGGGGWVGGGEGMNKCEHLLYQQMIK